MVYKENSKIVGFATIDIKNGKGRTPLFAVKREYEGKGISFALMRAMESVLKREGCPVVVGGTQKLNEMSNYIQDFKHKFSWEHFVQGIESIYHRI